MSNDIVTEPVSRRTSDPGNRDGLTPEQRRLRDQGLGVLARMIVEHVIGHPDEHEEWMADDEPPEAA